MQTDVLIIGGSAAGLACAAQMERNQIPYILVEKEGQVGTAWRNHYDRLHLHTNKEHSGLPYLPFPKEVLKYPSKKQVVDYLETYVKALNIRPVFNTSVTNVKRDQSTWKISTTTQDFSAKHVIVATGYNRVPVIPNWPGQAHFSGDIIHSSVYKNGLPYKNKSVLVVGFGNSAGEIAICLHEHGASSHLAVKGGVNIIPRDIFGVPVLSIGIKQSKLPPALVDAINAPLLKWLIGDFTRYGLKKLPYGPTTQIRVHHRIPLLDVGTLDLIRKGHIKVHPAIKQFGAREVEFEDGSKLQVDAVILGTGYRPQVTEFLEDSSDLLDDAGVPLISGGRTAQPNLYFCGFYIAPTGMLREVGLESARILRLIQEA